MKGITMLSTSVYLILAILIGAAYGWLVTTNFLQSRIGTIIRVIAGIILAAFIAISASRQPLYYQKHLIETDHARMIVGIAIACIMALGSAATIWHYRKKYKQL
jgi:cytochrome bd-type quinol oxidase subunit 2